MILVTGSTGNVGREAVGQLLASGAPVTAVTRNAATANLPSDARVVEGDPSHPESLVLALRGVQSILLSPRAVGAGAAGLLRLAVEMGVKSVVVLSAITVEYGGGYRRFANAFLAIEELVRASGMLWTFLRCSQFASNAFVWAPQIRTTGMVRGAYGDAAVSPIHPRDVSAVATLALLDRQHAGKSYALTGPQSLTQRDQVRIIADVIETSLAWNEMPPEDIRAAMIAQGVSEDIPDRMLGYLAECIRNPGPSTTTVQDLLGRQALTFAQWAKENQKAFLTPPTTPFHR
jgi:uncharacterized protein YbjT (DUF2867 family)